MKTKQQIAKIEVRGPSEFCEHRLDRGLKTAPSFGVGPRVLGVLVLLSALSPYASTFGQSWNLVGNAGANPTNGNFLGTTDSLPLEIRVNGMRALRLEPTAIDTYHSNIVNVVGGSQVNFVSSGVIGATISGGGAGNYLGGHNTNSVSG